jgi:two-component system, OmpR family, response regulator
MRVLLIEDEVRTLAFVARALRAEGIVVVASGDGSEGLARALAHDHDLVILDLRLPNVDGLTLLRELHERKPDLPVLILSARGDLRSKLDGFELGAADYLVKPFSLAELLARVRVQLRRRRAAGEREILAAGELRLDLARREACVRGTVTRLTDGEFRLLHQLAERAGDVITREQLLAEVWGYDFDPRSNVVEVGIRRLRKKLGPDVQIETVRNVGYRFIAA